MTEKKSRIPPRDLAVPSMEDLSTVGHSGLPCVCQLCFHSVLIPSSYPVLGQPDVLPVSNKMKTVHCVCTLVQIGTDIAKVSPALQEIPELVLNERQHGFTTRDDILQILTPSCQLEVGVSWRILRSCLGSLNRYVCFCCRKRTHVCHAFTFHLQGISSPYF